MSIFIGNNPLRKEELSKGGSKKDPTCQTAEKVVLVGGALGNTPVVYSLAHENEDDFPSPIPQRNTPSPVPSESDSECDAPEAEVEFESPFPSPIPVRNTPTPVPNIDLNALDANGRTPLTAAIHAGDLNKVRLLCAMDDDVDFNKIDGNGWSPLTYATQLKNTEMMKALVAAGADVNGKNKDGQRPLFIAINLDDKNLATLLVQDLKADPNRANGDDQLPYEYAFYLGRIPTWGDALKNLGACPEIAKEWLERKFLAHVWGHGGKTMLEQSNGVTHILSYLGMPKPMATILFDTFVKSFVQSHPQFTKTEQDEIADMSLNSVCGEKGITNAEVVARMNAGKPTLILGGSNKENDQSGHAIAYVVTKDRLYVCNRGDGRDDKFAVRAYKLEPHMRCEKLIENLREIYPNMAALNKNFKVLPVELALHATKTTHLDFDDPKEKAVMLSKIRTLFATDKAFNDFIAAPGFELIPSESIQLKDQSAPNCVLSTAVKGAAAAIFKHYKKDHDVYKQFTAFMRKEALIRYLEKTTNPDIPLLIAIGTHLAQKGATKKHYDKSTDKIFDLLKKHTGITPRRRK